MSAQNPPLRGRTLLAGKVISNFGQSTIDCVVRRISDHGATIELESAFGTPHHFHLLIPGEGAPQPCKRVWQSGKELGLEFEPIDAVADDSAAPPDGRERRSDSLLPAQMLALKSALDTIQIGVVLLDRHLRSQFINRAFRRMWNVPDSMADSRPAFVALLYHGRNTNAYQMASSDIDA